MEERKINISSVSSIEKQYAIFQKFASLGKGEKIELINNHDPKPFIISFVKH